MTVATLVDARGKALGPTGSAGKCPGCGSGADRREASGAFGQAWPVCSKCGHEWKDETWVAQ